MHFKQPNSQHPLIAHHISCGGPSLLASPGGTGPITLIASREEVRVGSRSIMILHDAFLAGFDKSFIPFQPTQRACATMHDLPMCLLKAQSAFVPPLK